MIEADQFAYEIAVVGLSGRFPGARNLEEFWKRLCEGTELITFFSDEELLRAGADAAALDDPHYVRAEAVLEDVELFDAAFFGFTPREAQTLDPQHRLFLEESWAALENAGYNPETYQGRIGVFGGESLNTYFLHNLYPNRKLLDSLGASQVVIANDRDYLATQVSFRLNLKGPSLSIQTACSTSLVAVHLACQSLLNRECDMALAGGVSVSVPQGLGGHYQEGGIISPDGHCRAFDAKARGTVKGSGVGVVVLKRLVDALNDRDTIHAVIKGSAINNDGAMKVGYTAPAVEGQASVIEEALALASVEPETIGYVEAHGTGTALGDPVEIAALTQAFRTGTQAMGFCTIGSVKTNIGHLDAAAGVAGLIKTILALEHRQIPPSLHFEQPNPNIDFTTSPFFVNTELRRWDTNGTPRRAGVSSFGIGGTNAHVVLEEAPASTTFNPPGSPHLLVLSARTQNALVQASGNLATHLKRHPSLALADVAYTLSAGRKEFEHRIAIVCRDVDDAVATLSTPEPWRELTGAPRHAKRPVAFMFPGQGAQYAGMGRELYEREPVFRSELDHCAELLKPWLDLREIVYADDLPPDEAAARLAETRFAQPALFAIEYALAKLWTSWGVSPQAMIGHSIGEYVSACLAGVFSLADALQLVAARGDIIQRLPRGAMLAVSLTQREAEHFLSEQISLAAVNSPALCVFSGAIEAIEQLERRLTEEGTICRRLHTSHAFHSAMMEPATEEFAALVRRVERRAPQIPYVSNVTGRWVTEEQAVDPDYWVRHLREPVHFSLGVAELLKDPAIVLLEVGPGQTLAALARQQPGGAAESVALASLGPPREAHSEVEFLLKTIGQLWVEGVEIDWSRFYAGQQRRRVELPPYPFERRRYWIDPPSSSSGSAVPDIAPVKKPRLADWFYVPSWKRLGAPQTEVEAGSFWIVFTNGSGLGRRIIRTLTNGGARVVSVGAGEGFRKMGQLAYEINPRRRQDYESLLQDLALLDQSLVRILHLWSVTTDDASGSLTPDAVDSARAKGFDSLVLLAQAAGERYAPARLEIGAVTNNAHALTGEETIEPGKALVFGPCRVIPLEYPNVGCRNIDVALSVGGNAQEQELTDQLIGELAHPNGNQIIAYRGRHRWVQTFEPLQLSAANVTQPSASRLREGGVYLLTGGLSDIDLALSEYLARAVRARLVLTAPADFLPREIWQQWFETHDETNTVSRRIRALLALEDLGAEILTVCADVSDPEQLRLVVDRAREHFGEINGVIHTAAIYGGGVIQLHSFDPGDRILSPKMHGTLALHSALSETELDFFVLFSSSLAHTGVLGQVDFCAASAFLDAVAQCEWQRGKTFTVAIDWRLPQWEQWTTTGAAGAQSEFAEVREAFGITPAEGVEAFARVLSGNQPQVVVSTQDFQAVVEQSRAAATENLAGRIEETKLFDDGEKFSTNAEVETAIIKIWRGLFGIDSIRPSDNFFDHGGNSLIALQLVAQLRSTFKIDLPLRVVFESQTVTALAARVFELITREQEMVELESLLREVESLAPEELQARLQLEISTAAEPHKSVDHLDADDSAAKDQPAKSVSFSLYFFSDDGSKASDDKYRLVLESAKFADRHGFSAVWTPERHFQDFGGLYPNPSVLSAALAVSTERIQIRAGSVALPLHHPVRVAEEWSIVDNLSGGRVGVSFASGWHRDDFIFAPDVYDERKEVMFRHIELIQKLWAGEKVKLPTAGSDVEFRILPRPLQPALPIWITSSGSAETWRRAGAIGANVLAAYVGYSHDELSQRIKLYRDARAKHGHDPRAGVVTIMLHTFIGDNDEAVKEKVRAPFSSYLRTYFRQYENVAAGVEGITEADKDALMSAAFDKYFESSTLLGAPGKCARLIDALAGIGVDEIACLIDFGVDADSVLDSLSRLDELRAQYASPQIV